MLQRREWIFIKWQKLFEMGRGTLSGYGIQTSARTSAKIFGTEKEGELRWNYSTVNSAQRLSATLSIRPSGRVQAIDM
jgi:hypothetical protein